MGEIQPPPILLRNETWNQETLRRTVVRHQLYHMEILVLYSNCWTELQLHSRQVAVTTPLPSPDSTCLWFTDETARARQRHNGEILLFRLKAAGYSASHHHDTKSRTIYSSGQLKAVNRVQRHTRWTVHVGYWSIVQLLTIPDWLLDCVTDQNFILVGQIGPDTKREEVWTYGNSKSFNINLSGSVPLADPP